MNLRPSTSILSNASKELNANSAQSLLRRLAVSGGFAAAIIVGGIGSSGLYALRRTMMHDADARISHAAILSRELVDRVLAERAHQVELIANEPMVVAAAEKGAAEALREGLPAKFG